MDILPKGFVVKFVPMENVQQGVGVLMINPNDMPNVGKDVNGEIVFENFGKKKPRKKKEFKDFPPQVIKVYELSIIFFPEHLQPKTARQKNSWLEVIDNLIRLDKIPPEHIPPIVRWARSHKFWRKNFLSMLKLRKKDKQNGVKYIVRFSEEMKRGGQPLPPEDKAKKTANAVEYLNL